VPTTGKKTEEKSSQPAKPAVPQASAAKPTGTGKSRLRLDPVDTLSERIKSLETTNTAKNTLEEVARDNQKMQQLQADLRILLDQAVKNEASLAAMRERLEKAESNQVSLTIVYLLVALLLLCVAALVYFVSRQPRLGAQDASTKPVKPQSADAVNNPSQQALDGEAPYSQAGDIDVNLLDLDDASFGEMMGDKSVAMPTNKSKHHNFNADTLVDIRQQADFLAKLGKVDEALEILEKGIHANPVESPMLYLDLLVIANNFSRKTDFRQFRAEFEKLFNATVPEFALFRDEGRKLDAYPALLEHINGQWDSPNVLDVIEACILRDPDATESDPFDLAAFRELVNMHAAATQQHRANA
jgi:tetratricopeptide (TPR) repeat protein